MDKKLIEKLKQKFTLNNGIFRVPIDELLNSNFTDKEIIEVLKNVSGCIYPNIKLDYKQEVSDFFKSNGIDSNDFSKFDIIVEYNDEGKKVLGVVIESDAKLQKDVTKLLDVIDNFKASDDTVIECIDITTRKSNKTKNDHNKPYNGKNKKYNSDFDKLIFNLFS